MNFIQKTCIKQIDMPGIPSVYLDEAKAHEEAFRLIITDVSKMSVEHLSVEEIYTKYTIEPPRPSWRILDFNELARDIYEYSCGTDMMNLAGGGTKDIWAIIDEEPVHVKNIGRWRS